MSPISNSVSVYVCQAGGGYRARAGRGKRATIATCTSSDIDAVQRAAAKYFKLDPSNTVKPGDLGVEFVSATNARPSVSLYTVTLPAPSDATA